MTSAALALKYSKKMKLRKCNTFLRSRSYNLFDNRDAFEQFNYCEITAVVIKPFYNETNVCSIFIKSVSIIPVSYKLAVKITLSIYAEVSHN